jgi:hypothetical protein
MRGTLRLTRSNPKNLSAHPIHRWTGLVELPARQRSPRCFLASSAADPDDWTDSVYTFNHSVVPIPLTAHFSPCSPMFPHPLHPAEVPTRVMR